MKFLLIDDSPSDRERILRVLEEEFRDSEFVEITRSRDWEEALAGGVFDLVLTEYRLDWTDGLEVLRTIRKRFPHLPVVMVTGTGSEEIAVEGMKSGLSDYVSKGSLHRLSAAVRQSLEKAADRDITGLKRAEETLRRKREELAASSRILLVSYLGVPLVAQDKTIGILHLLTTQPKVFAKEDVDFFRTLAGQAAIAIENARLFDEARQAEQKYRSIFENAVEGIFQTTPDGRCLMANPAAVRMLGYECPEELMTDITDIEWQLYVDPERRSALKRLLEERGVVQGFECQFNRKDGSTIWVSMSLRAVRDANGVVFCHEGTVEDITERKRAEEAMESALKDWQNTFEAISDGLWILDLEGRVVRSNGRIESLLGIRTEDIRGRHCYQVVHSAPDFIESCVFQRVKQTHTRGWAELEDQERGVWLQVTVDPLYDKSGAIEGAVHVIRDITEHKRSEERLQQQLMRISLLSQIARAIAERQDLESIFRVVLGRLEEHLPIDFGEGLLFDPQSDTLTVAARGPKSRQLAGELMMMTEKDLSDRARQYLEMIQTAGRDIAHIVARMREFYRKREEREKLFEINLNDLIQQVIDMSSPRWKDIPQEKGVVVEMRTDFAPHPARVRGVNSEIREALTNLIFNAVDAMPHGGMLAIRTYAVGCLDRRERPPGIAPAGRGGGLRHRDRHGRRDAPTLHGAVLQHEGRARDGPGALDGVRSDAATRGPH